LDFQPGSGYVYNNSGYVLLGYLIEKISGQSYRDFVVMNLFKPLSMKDSGYDSHSAIIAQRASGYVNVANEFHNADYLDMSIPYAAGSLYSTTHDLHKWVENLFAGTIISLKSLKKMLTPNINDYGFGVIIQPIDGSNVIMHGGGINGFNTMLLHSPEDKLTIIILANVNGIGFVPGDIVTKLVTVAHGNCVKLPSERKEISLSNKVLHKFAGIYKLKLMNKAYPLPETDFVITLENNYLMAEMANKIKIRLIPEFDNSFFVKIPDMQIEFIHTPEGNIAKFIARQDGDEYIGIPV
jgi:CubicO group peptidase (beta-lactamase class C family)